MKMVLVTLAKNSKANVMGLANSLIHREVSMMDSGKMGIFMVLELCITKLV